MRASIARRSRTSGVEGDGLEAARSIIEVFPGGFRFIYMRIDVYAKHGSSSA
jgi:hypothetical protein